MYTLIGIAFIIGYVAIALEHNLKIDKAASALFTAVICWLLVVIGKTTLFPGIPAEADHILGERLLEHLGDISGILFFLLGVFM